ncbi:GNAT family N-acetyltransferase [Falsibacillus albus]|uniref:GNAT family N-acetyltransferase n=1 Tax=Falsibacillus albus TaxID=2478915 RepID=A0A3L7K2R8_9BACI|nr:GNAT family N-acetyltransferase [Falsibacillus albus]RLQ97110.1 GNAT family N-acetyltransferase [Falsibacillus albus]
MITFEKNKQEWMEIELAIMNSNPAYNLLTHGRELLFEKDIKEEYKESVELETERYLVKENDRWIGIIDFCPHNPKDGKPWIGLLVLHSSMQKKGKGKEVYHLFEEKLINRGFKEARLGIIDGNRGARRFWESLGFQQYTQKEWKGKKIYCCQKKISNWS